MPVGPDYSIPSWIHGANPLSAVESGASLGLRIAESNQRAAIAYAEMQRRQQEFQQQMDVAQQRLEQQQAFQQQQFQAEQQIAQENQLRKDQELQINNAYKQGQLGLKKQQLEMTAKAAAEKANASGRFLQSLQTLTSGYIAEEGLTEEQARSKAVPQALFDSGLFQYLPPNALAQMAKSTMRPEASFIDLPGGKKGIVQPSGQVTVIPGTEYPEPKFNLMPGVGARPGRITGITGATAEQLGQFGITNKYNFKKKSESPSESPKTVRVKSPDGKTGTIPSDQLDAAKAQGYTELE